MRRSLREGPAVRDKPVPRPVPTVYEQVAAAKRGDREAFAHLYRGHVARVYDYAARRLPNSEMAEEATQEIFYRAFRNIARCRTETLFPGWLFGIARNVIADVYRSRCSLTEPLEYAEAVADPQAQPVEQMLVAERRAELLAVRDHCLSPSERDLFDLLLSDLTDQEIAAALGRRYGAIRTAHWRLLNKLRRCFGGMVNERETDHVAL